MQKGTIWCRFLAPDLRGLGGLGGRNMYNMVGVMVPTKVYLLEAVTELLVWGQDINTAMELAMVFRWQ